MATWQLGLLATVLLGASYAIWRLTRCRHPNPHYVRAVVRQNANGQTIEMEPARYICYECGRTWLMRQRDAAWHATSLRHAFSGYDESKAARAATRARIEEEQRRFLAAHRALDERTAVKTHPPRARTMRRPHANVIDLNSRLSGVSPENHHLGARHAAGAPHASHQA
jgi:hypothetical protein